MTYDHSLKIVKRSVGAVALQDITGRHFRSWFRAWRFPEGEDGPEHVTRARNCMTMLRVVLSFGTSLRFKDCMELREALSTIDFPTAPKRSQVLTLDHVQAYCKAAHEAGRPSLALGLTLQFELTLRQWDVIGYWERRDQAPDSGIWEGRWQWQNGLTWSHIDEHMILRKRTTKNGLPAEYDLTLYPMVMEELARIPLERRVGPVVINEKTGLPYRYRTYSHDFRKIARTCGIPDDVLNRDARAGGLTEGDAAGADLNALRHHASHSNTATTTRYTRGVLKNTEKVARLRVASRRINDAD